MKLGILPIRGLASFFRRRLGVKATQNKKPKEQLGSAVLVLKVALSSV